MDQHEYTMPLFVHDDGTLAVHGGDIRGLVIEAESFEELRAELLRLAPQLLRTNHGLTNEEIEHATLLVAFRDVADAAEPVLETRATQTPKLLWEDSPHIKSIACA